MEKKVHVFGNFILFCIAIIWSSCNDEETLSAAKGEPLWLTANIQMTGTEGSYKLDGGESVGLWMSSDNKTPLEQADIARNTKFYQSAAGLVSEPRTYWGNHQEVHIYGYYPFDSVAIVSPQSYLFTVKSDQKQPENVSASDLLWTSKTASQTNGGEKIQLDFSHLMSKIIINIRGAYPEVGSFRESTAQIKNVISDAFVNLKEGSVSPATTRTDIDATPLNTVYENYESSLQAILVPQTFKAGIPFLNIKTKGNVDNEWAPDQDITIEKGTQLILDVLIEETECIVTIKEISPWEVDENTLQAEAIEQLPTYELYDFYSRFGVQGIVVALDEGSNGQHGWIISTDETYLSWLSTDVSNLKGYSRTDAILNLKLALQEDPTLEKFPAIKWCDDKNKERSTLEDLEQNGMEGRWILPPINTLKSIFGDQFLAYNKTSNLERLNTAIENSSVPSSQKIKLPNIDWTDYSLVIEYRSSTCTSYTSGEVTTNVLRWAPYDYLMFSGTGVFYSTADAFTSCRVRAFCHF